MEDNNQDNYHLNTSELIDSNYITPNYNSTTVRFQNIEPILKQEDGFQYFIKYNTCFIR